ncbi:LysR family transcriptional regulator [Marinomonas epiphytica]
MYDLNEIETFISVMKTGSLTDSAMELGVSKSTLSRRIQHLESVLRQPLLRRQANRLIANEAGQKFLPFAKRLMQTADDGQKAVEELKDGVNGKITVYVDNHLVRGWFSHHMFAFLDEHPGVYMEVKTGDGIQQTIDDNSVSICIGHKADERLRYDPLGQLSQGIYISPNYLNEVGPINHPEDLKNIAWLNMQRSPHNVPISLHHPIQGAIELDVRTMRLSLDQFALYLDALARGNGVGVLPNFLVERFLTRHPDSLVKCLPSWQSDPLDVYIQYPFGVLPKKLGTFITFLKHKSKMFY